MLLATTALNPTPEKRPHVLRKHCIYRPTRHLRLRPVQIEYTIDSPFIPLHHVRLAIPRLNPIEQVPVTGRQPLVQHLVPVRLQAVPVAVVPASTFWCGL